MTDITNSPQTKDKMGHDRYNNKARKYGKLPIIGEMLSS